jgi:hypothetical protein
MPDPKLQLFKVECRTGEGATFTFFVPARSLDEAIVQAMISASEVRVQERDVTDPFKEVGLEVRVGTFAAPGSAEVIFNDWTRLSN